MNRLIIARSLFRTINQSNIVPVQKRFSSHGYGNDIGPPASFNQLPQPEGDWAENHNKKQQKYNIFLAAATVFFVGTVAFVKQSGIIFFNASPPDTYE